MDRAVTSAPKPFGEVIWPDSTPERACADAGLDWTVGTVPLYLGTGEAVEGTYAAVRSDTRAVLEVVGRRYRPASNRQLFAYADLVRTGSGYRLGWDRAGEMYGGRLAWITCRWGQTTPLPNGDSVDALMMLTLSHRKGSHLYRMVPLVVRASTGVPLALSGVNSTGGLHVPGFPLKMEPPDPIRPVRLFESALETYRTQQAALYTRPATPRRQGHYLRTLNVSLKAGRGDVIWWDLWNDVALWADRLGRPESAWIGKSATLKRRAWDLALNMASN
jgi:hypothetical protein